MPTRRGVTGAPRDQLLAGAWPDGEVDGPAAVAQQLARALAAALAGRSVRQVAREADLRHTTVLALLNGQRWPDFVTVVKLEDALAATLWPRRYG
jgi:DNA-binding phage protein